jgi:hypothetical protein
MDFIARANPRTAISVLIGLVAFITTSILIYLAPANPPWIVWVCIADVVVLEVAAGAMYVRGFQTATGGRQGVSTASQVAVMWITASLGGTGAGLDWAVITSRIHWPGTAILLLIGLRWVVLGVLTVPILLADTVHLEGQRGLTRIKLERLNLVDRVESALWALCAIPVTDQDRTTFQLLTDEVDLIRNRMRGLGSTNVGADHARMGTLVDSFAQEVDACSAAPAADRSPNIAQLQTTLREISRELSRPVFPPVR